MLPLNALFLLLASSPWAPAEWNVHLNFGRESETPTWFDESFGASGARLALSVPVCIQPEASTEIKDEFLGRRCDCLQILDDSSYITIKGEEKIRFEANGAWRLNTRQTRVVGDASTVRIVIDLKDKILRNDVALTPQRLYLTANAWREDELGIAEERMERIQRKSRIAQETLDAQLSHDTGDRRLDGTNILDTAAASIDMATLVKRRDDALFELRQAQQFLPFKTLSPQGGHWPGSDEELTLQEGDIFIKRPGGFLNPDELVVVGRWTATPECEYEYVDEEDFDLEEQDNAELA